MRIHSILLIYLLSFIVFSCNTNSKHTENAVKKIVVPEFNADSAYGFVKTQVDFGPRIPNSLAHRKAGDYFTRQFKKYGAKVIIQEFVATTFDNQKINLRNIVASFNPEKKKRILLAAHWDTRPFSDKDQEKPNGTFDGANDGASGVGILLEISRIFSTQPPDVGVDIILFDGEDWGERDGRHGTHPLPENLKEWWCLGSQHWSRNKHKSNYTANYGILLDMVGGKNALFVKEGYSKEYAPGITDKVWKEASRLGFSHIFLQQEIGPVTDDHRFVNEVGKIPMIDIVSFDPITGFGAFHHTQDDNLSLIDKETLRAVGKTVLQVVYSE